MKQALRLPEINLRHITWVVLIYCGIVSAVWPRRTYDVWWHLAAGEWMVQNHEIPHEDPFTWTREGEEWTAHEWAWELPMYLLYSRWGHNGLMGLRILVALVTCSLLAWLMLRKGAPPAAVMGVGAFAIFAARPLFNDRPQAATLPFFVAMLCLIQQAEDGKERWLLIGAPLLMAAWVNIHGGFIYGPALIGLYILCKVPTWIGQWRREDALSPCPGYLMGALLLAMAACFINPNGFEGATYPLEYVIGGHAWHTNVISEYDSPDFSSSVFMLLGYLIVFSMAAFAASGRRSTLWEVALTAVFLYTALKWQRNAALFAFAIGPILALHAGDILARVGLFRDSEQPEGRPIALYWAIVGVLAVSAAISLPSAARKAGEAWQEDQPVECLQYIQESGIQGRMYNTYRMGGYLIWHLWPEHQVMLDGRADVMGRELVSDWRQAHRLDDGWEEILEKYEIDWAIISSSAALVRGLEEHDQWRLVCEEPTARLFVRRGSIADRTTFEQD